MQQSEFFRDHSHKHEDKVLFELSPAELIRRGNLRVEKCELRDAGVYFELALDKAKSLRDTRQTSEALGHLLKYSSEIGDESSTQKWISELDIFVAQNDQTLAAQIWYCKGIVAFRSAQYKKAQVLFHRFWREIEREEDKEESPGTYRSDWLRSKAQALLALALVALNQGKLKRAQYLGAVILKYAQQARPRGILASTHLLLCRVAERSGDTATAKKCLQSAFAESVAEHNWYHYLFVLYGFARVARMEQDFVQAHFFLDLLEKALVQEEFRVLRSEIAEERVKLNLNRVDVELDPQRGVIRLREGEVSLRRQQLLVQILLHLAEAHDETSAENMSERSMSEDNRDARLGRSKASIIESVWKEQYDPETHDGKLYYNINRIRKLIEPDPKNPQYLLNWRQGYRWAPELKIRIIRENYS